MAKRVILQLHYGKKSNITVILQLHYGKKSNITGTLWQKE